MTDAKRGAFDVLLVWSLDRFGRSMAGNVNDALALDRAGVELLSVREPWLDTGGPVRPAKRPCLTRGPVELSSPTGMRANLVADPRRATDAAVNVVRAILDAGGVTRKSLHDATEDESVRHMMRTSRRLIGDQRERPGYEHRGALPKHETEPRRLCGMSRGAGVSALTHASEGSHERGQVGASGRVEV
jgi:hypothetical protein